MYLEEIWGTYSDEGHYNCCDGLSLDWCTGRWGFYFLGYNMAVMMFKCLGVSHHVIDV